jgi:RHS repeat-associated protein
VANDPKARVAYNLRFPGQVFDGQAELHQNGRRDFNPAVGKYVESDPAGLAASINTYAYVDSDPLLFFDPDGLGTEGGQKNKLLPGVPPKSALGKALSYAAGQWTKLTQFLEHPDAAIDNNYLENQIRPFAIGRRSWLFAGTKQGARASANLYSLVRCAEVNGLEPYAYLLHLLEELPKASTTEALEALLPWNVKPLLKAQRGAA